MKSTKEFKEVVKSYLDNRASEDDLFAKSYAKADKNIDDCIIYILNTVRKSNCNAFADDEVYSMAIHYYDEESINVGKPIKARVVVNHTIELTEKDKLQAKVDAMKQLQNQLYKDMIAPQPKQKYKQKENIGVQQVSLFD